MEQLDQWNRKKGAKNVKKLLEVDELICRRCLGSWFSKVEHPKVCARCKSPYWNTERLKAGAVGARNKYGFDEWEIAKWYKLEKFALPNGFPDTAKNETRWRSLAQFARRRGLVAQFDGHKGPMYARLVKA